MKCPDCHKELKISFDGTKYIARCSYCGYNKKIFAKTLDEVESLIIKASQEREPKDVLVKRKTKSEIFDLIRNGGYEPEQLPKEVKRIINNPNLELVYYSFFEAKQPNFAKKDPGIPKPLIELLNKRGLKKLYEFQAKAFDAIIKGNDIVIVAPTGTGKTESFILPILTMIWEKNPNPLTRRGVQAIIIYPTKALARDQHSKIRYYGSALSINCAIFDGDTPPKEKERILQYPPDILITNPDMLHYHLRRKEFQAIISTVRFVVIDEIHTAVGAFGSNIYFILKRIGRLAHQKVQFISASATIENAKEFTSRLFNRNVIEIEEKEARKAPMHLLIVLPISVSQYTVTNSIVRELVKAGRKTLCFQNNHKNAEIVNIMLQKAKIKSGIHRAGLTRKERKRIEEEYKNGKIETLVATPTLELGIDIGDVDAVVSSIVDITRFIQRLGRAGRKGQESISVLILRPDDPISTYYTYYPEKYFSDLSRGYVEPQNEIVAYFQLIAATLDKPLDKNEFSEFNGIINKIKEDGIIKLSTRSRYLIADRKKALKLLNAYSIRGIGDNVVIKEPPKVLGERSMPMAARELHPGAIYLHGGKYYLSQKFEYKKEWGRGEAIVTNIEPQRTKTTALRYAIPEVIKIIEKKEVFGTTAFYCDLYIIEHVIGFKEEDIYTGELIAIRDLAEPIIYSFKTKGFMFTAPKPFDVVKIQKALPEEEVIMGSFHALEHVLIESSAMLTGGGTTEIGGISMGDSGIIFVYDGAKGGSGLSKLLYDRLKEAFQRALIILKNCDCKSIDGCPRCTYSFQCGNNNKPLNKIGAIETIELLKKKKVTPKLNYEQYEAII